MAYRHLRPLLFRLDPEVAHDLAHRALQLADRVPGVLPTMFATDLGHRPELRQRRCGIDFPAPVGLAAGFDKDGRSAPGLARTGFGFLEVGTVTPKAQLGNPKPRLLRHLASESLQNAMGFNNAGMDRMATALERYRRLERTVPLAVNIGKNKTTPLEQAHNDYRQLFRRFAALADFFVVNVSSPNTPGLRSLQGSESVRSLVAVGREETPKPILVKLAPDLEIDEIVSVAASASEAGAAGLVLTNTTIDYSLIPSARPFGGLSGRVLRSRSFEILRQVARVVDRDLTLISVGGIDSAAEVYRRLRAGAHLVEIYSGLVFHGLGLIARIHTELVERLQADGVSNVEEIIGADL